MHRAARNKSVPKSAIFSLFAAYTLHALLGILVLGVDLEHFSEFRAGLLYQLPVRLIISLFTRHDQSLAEPEVCLGEVLVKRNGFPEMGDRFFDLLPVFLASPFLVEKLQQCLAPGKMEAGILEAQG